MYSEIAKPIDTTIQRRGVGCLPSGRRCPIPDRWHSSLWLCKPSGVVLTTTPSSCDTGSQATHVVEQHLRSPSWAQPGWMWAHSNCSTACLQRWWIRAT